MTTIHLVDQSKKVNSTQTKSAGKGLTIYGNLVAKAWGLQAVTVTTVATPGAWEFYIVDALPAGSPANALGWHDYVDAKVVSYTSTATTMPPIRQNSGRSRRSASSSRWAAA